VGCLSADVQLILYWFFFPLLSTEIWWQGFPISYSLNLSVKISVSCFGVARASLERTSSFGDSHVALERRLKTTLEFPWRFSEVPLLNLLLLRQFTTFYLNSSFPFAQGPTLGAKTVNRFAVHSLLVWKCSCSGPVLGTRK
jgi:hypothetical protein